MNSIAGYNEYLPSNTPKDQNIPKGHLNTLLLSKSTPRVPSILIVLLYIPYHIDLNLLDSTIDLLLY